MIKIESSRYGMPLYVIYPGEHFFTSERCVLNTITGSCLVVCLYDKERRMGGIGHFIVPGTIGTEGIYADEIAEHGIYNIELIVAEYVKKGGDRRCLKAKIFGSGYIAGSTLGGVVKSNIWFIHEYLKKESILIESDDLGGNYRRYIIFEPFSGKVYRKILKNNDENSEFIKLEKEYIDLSFRKKDIKTNYVLFE